MVRLIKMEAEISNQPIVETPQKVNKKNNFLVSLLSILLLLSCIIAGFFAYQTQKLVRELTEQRNLVIPSPISTPTADSTTNWKTYKYLDMFEIKVPNDYKIVDKGSNRIEIGNYISIWSSTMNPEDCRGDCTMSGPQPTKIINGISMKYVKSWWGEIGGNIAQSFIAYIVPIKDKYIIIQLQELPFTKEYEVGREIKDIDPKQVELFDQILSTFELIESKSSSSPVACTMEAKICPDGSSVERIGPNCEFAKCPATSPQP